MSAPPATRSLLRHTRFLLRRQPARHASTATETAAKAKDTAAETAFKAKDAALGAVSKASEGLTRVTSSGGNAVSSAADRAKNALSSVSGRTGRVISFVESLIPPTVYYARVGLELSKMVLQGQKMSPPSISQFQSYLNPLLHAARNPNTLIKTIGETTSSAASAASKTTPESIMSQIRHLSTAQVVSVSVIGAEVLGFFTVGTMIGRLKIVGYHGEVHHEHE